MTAELEHQQHQHCFQERLLFMFPVYISVCVYVDDDGTSAEAPTDNHHVTINIKITALRTHATC